MAMYKMRKKQTLSEWLNNNTFWNVCEINKEDKNYDTNIYHMQKGWKSMQWKLKLQVNQLERNGFSYNIDIWQNHRA